jgi:predicted acyl esterase
MKANVVRLVLTLAIGCAGAASATENAPVLEEVWIPMPDGVRLSADIYRPGDAAANEEFPVLLEYLPYRKMESRGRRNYPLYEYFVKRGYIVARVDIRGTGQSEGQLIPYEYSEQEQQDGEAVIDWLSRQSFSSGKVGMFGISWGGFNSIHMAMRNPPALKAIIAIEATDDIYQDDVHFMDGIMHVDSYEVGMDVANAMPGAPDYRIDERFFEDRFDRPPWLLHYKQYQRDGPFWNRASLNVDYSRIKIPTFVIGGWYDGYRDSVPRMLEHMSAPVKGMIGPWHHTMPNWGYPGTPIEWREQAVRWFDHWLKGDDNGVMDEPSFAVYIRDYHPPGFHVDTIPGNWRLEEGWPIERSRPYELFPQTDHLLSTHKPDTDKHRIRYVPSTGIEAGGSVMWWGDLAEDQRPTDNYSLVYDTESLEEDLEILGFPEVRLNASSDAPLVHWFARLSDVAPDGSVTLITGAGLNGAHRNSAEEPQALEPGRVYPLDIEMHFTSWVFPKGHRIRLSISNAQWPMFWPSPYPAETTLQLGGEDPTRLVLPTVPEGNRPTPSYSLPGEDTYMPGYGGSETEMVSGYAEIVESIRDHREKTTTLLMRNSGSTEYPWGVERFLERIQHKTHDLEPEKTSVQTDYTVTVELEDRRLIWEGVLDLRGDREFFYLNYTRRLLEGENVLREKTWEEKIRRDFQ